MLTPKFPTTEEEVKCVLDTYRIKKYKINDDLSVDVFEDIDFFSKDLYYFPVKFNIIKGDFKFNRCKIKSLIGGPVEVWGSFNGYFNHLISLLYAPKYVAGHFDVSYNWLREILVHSLMVGGNFNCSMNLYSFSKEEVSKKIEVQGGILV